MQFNCVQSDTITGPGDTNSTNALISALTAWKAKLCSWNILEID